MISTINGSLPRLRIVVVAAGFSLRLGQPKALACVRGESLLRRTLSLLRPFAAASRLIVVVPPRAGRYRNGVAPGRVDFIVNHGRAAGLTSSLQAGIMHARFSAAVLLLPVDLVELQARDVARLIAGWRGARRKVAARRIGHDPGTPLILPRGLYQKSLCGTTHQGLRDFVRRLPREAVRLVSLPSAAADVDTPSDLARARRRPQSRLRAPAGSRRRSP